MSREELIEKMCEADGEARGCDKFASFTNATKLELRKGMAAALDVAVGELLGDATDQEWARGNWRGPDDQRMDRRCIDVSILRSRRSRYLKPKSAEERVTVKDGGRVFIDGELAATATSVPIACMIMNSLIRQFKEQPK